jgi:maltose alpha-D-glucosyltransferase/alpha-amylase
MLHNLDAEPYEVKLAAKAKFGQVKLINVLSDDHSSPDKKGDHCILLEPYGYHWYRVGPGEDLLKRSDT